MRDPFSRLSTWYFSKKSLPYWGIILLDCCLILFSGLLVYTLNNGVLSTLDILGHLLVTLLVCLIPYLVGFRLFHTYSASSFFSVSFIVSSLLWYKGGIRRLIWFDLRGRVSGIDGFLSLFDVYP